MAEQAQQFDNRLYITGRVGIPPWLLAKKSKPFVFTGALNGLVAAASQPVTIQIHDDAYFLVEEIQILSSDLTVTQDQSTVQITDNSQSQSWSNIPIPLRDLAGHGWAPKYLSDPNILRPTSSITLQITNNSAGTLSYSVALVGRKIYGVTADEANIVTRRMWYQYGLSVPSLAGSALNQQFNLNIYNESDFLLKKLISQQLIDGVLAATGGAINQEVMIQLRDTTNDTYLFSDFCAARLVFGMYQGGQTATGASWGTGQPFCLKKPWLLRRNGVFQVTLNNNATSAYANGFILVFEGIRIFDAR